MWQETLTALTGSENQRSHWANQKNFHPAGSYHSLLHLPSALNCFLQSNHHLGCPNGFSYLLQAALSACCFLSPELPQKPENHLVCCCCFFWCCCCRVLLIWFGLWCSWLWGGRMKEEEEEQLWKPWEWKLKNVVWRVCLFTRWKQRRRIHNLLFLWLKILRKWVGFVCFSKKIDHILLALFLLKFSIILVLWTFFWKLFYIVIFDVPVFWWWGKKMLGCVFNRQLIENNRYWADWESLVFYLN